MKTSMSKSVIAVMVSAGVLLSGQWALAGNLPGWGGATTTTNQPRVQQPRQPLVSEPAPVPVQTVQPPPSSWSPPRTTSEPASSPTGPTPVPRSRSYKPTTRTRTAPSPVLPKTGGRALGIAPPRQGAAGSSARTETAQQDVPGKKARFRITINGFHVFAVKGVLPRRGHSYYIAAKVLKYSQWGAISSNMTKATSVIGNTNKFPGAIKGGTATKNGGFRNGDTYPTSVPYTAGRAYSNRLPLLVWEGELEEGGDVVVIEPTIWEKREGVDIFNVWRRQVPSQITNLLKCSPNEFSSNSVSYPIPEWTQQNSAPIDKLISSNNLLAEGRICVTITPRDIFRPLGRNKPDAIPGYTEKIFPARPSMTDPHGLLLNYSKAEMIADERQTKPVTLVTYEESSKNMDEPGGFPDGFIRANQRNSNVLPAGGIQPFWFGSQGNSESLHWNKITIRTGDLSNMANFFSLYTVKPIIPDSTAIELYLQIQKLSQ